MSVEEVKPDNTEISTEEPVNPNNVQISIYSWALDKRVQNKIKKFITHYVNQVITSKYYNVVSASKTPILINKPMISFIMFILNDIVTNYKKAIDKAPPTEADINSSEERMKFTRARMELFAEKDLITYINSYYTKHCLNVIDTYPEAIKKLTDYFEKNINGGDYCLFRGCDVYVFNTLLTRFLMIIITTYVSRILLRMKIQSQLIIDYIIQTEFENGFNNLYNIRSYIDKVVIVNKDKKEVSD
jgi:hypothetical protein